MVYGVTFNVAVFVTPDSVPEIVTVVFAVTFLCPIVNVTVDFPAGTVIVAGTVAAVVTELLRLTTLPPAGAGPESVIVPLTAVVELPFTVTGETEMESIVGERIVILELFELDPTVAVRVAVVVAVTDVVFTVNFPLGAPTAMLKLAGKLIALLTEPSFTTIEPLPDPGVALSVTTPLDVVPPVTLAGESVSVEIANGFRVRVADRAFPPHVAVIVTV
jgi:hypothetical protein